ncbi:MULTISPECIES: hypothetical protein [unclassified Haladaptatus]|uniref:COG4315 family predicted lipoprotein n=1 Tax=unclassified Haladaptatus TaxID=2622732 RepID=UPI0023E855C7|nr:MULTISPECIES: hypothetical protein [unclassified Haladaptatus]
MVLSRRLFLTVAASSALAGCVGGSGGGETTTQSTTAEPTTMADTTTTADGTAEETVQVASHPDLGDILVGPEGMTLYMFDSDTEGDPSSTCSGSCAETWPPLTVSESPTKAPAVSAALTTFDRGEGSTQVAAAGWPLYYFAPDENPGDANGQGVNDVWWVLRPDGTPVRQTNGTTTTDGGSYY